MPKLMPWLLTACCCLLLFTPRANAQEALEKRVKDLERVNSVLQEDLGRTQLQLDTTRTALKKTQTDLDAEIAARKSLADALTAEAAARKALEDRLAALQKQVDQQAVAQAEANKRALDAEAALAKRIDDANKALADLADRTGKQLAALQSALDKERAERIAGDAANAKQAKKNMTITYVLGAILGGWVASK